MNGVRDDPVVFLGGGAVGSYVGGVLAASGIEVVLIDGWAEHVEAIRAQGLRILSPEGEIVARPKAWHFVDAHGLRRLAPVAAFLTTKLYDTEWSATLLATWLAPQVPVVTMQNGLVEETVARAAGWGRTLGAVAGGLDVSLIGPGTVRRSRHRRASSSPVFKVGEMHGRVTPRVERLAALLDRVDLAVATSSLWRERWAKLCANAMTTGLSGLAGLTLREVYTREDTRAIAVMLGTEALDVGTALGFDTPALFGIPAEIWHAAATGDASAYARAIDAIAAQAGSMTGDGVSGTLQDLRKQRPTEVEFLNGFIAREGERLRLAVPVNEAVAAMIREAEAGKREIGGDALSEILARASRASSGFTRIASR